VYNDTVHSSNAVPVEQMKLWRGNRIHPVQGSTRQRMCRAGRATKGRRMNFWLSRAAETRTAYRFLYVVSERQRALLSRIVRVRTGIGALDPLSHSQRSFALQVLVNRSPSSIGECVSPSTCPDLLLLLFLRIRRKRVFGSTI